MTFFLATAPKLSFFYGFYKIFFCVISKKIFFMYLLSSCAMLSILVGSILALYEVKFKKFLAYSSTVHMGYIALALSTGTKLGAAVSFFYFFIYIMITISIFCIHLAIRLTWGVHTIKYLTDLVRVRDSHKWLCIFMAASLLSLAGVPPFMGFFGKLNIF